MSGDPRAHLLFAFVVVISLIAMGVTAQATEPPPDCVKCAPLSQELLRQGLRSIRNTHGLSLEIYYYNPSELPFRRQNASVEAGARCVTSRGMYVKKAARAISRLSFESADWTNIEPVAEFRFLRSGRTVFIALFSGGTAFGARYPAAPGLINGRIALFRSTPVRDLIDFARGMTSRADAHTICDVNFRQAPTTF